MNESKIEQFLDSWTKGVIEIGKAFLKKEDFEKEALKFLSKHYAFKTQQILFKPTFTKEKIFRNNLEDALSYFVGGNIEEDNGFAIKPWFKIRFSENKIVISHDSAIAMGNYYFTSVEDKKNETKVEYTFGYIKDKKGNLRINLHHSSIPHSNN